MTFADRREAGRLLAQELGHLAPAGQTRPDVVVLGLLRGGAPVAAEVAQVLRAPLDAVVVRKLGVPGRPELAMGAIAEEDVRVLEPRVIRQEGTAEREVAEVERRERGHLERRVRWLRSARPVLPLPGRIAVVVDDGVATGSTMAAAVQVVRARGAARVVVAVPVASPRALTWLREVADEVVCLQAPPSFRAVGEAYRNFAPVPDDEVARVLEAAERGGPP